MYSPRFANASAVSGSQPPNLSGLRLDDDDETGEWEDASSDDEPLDDPGTSDKATLGHIEELEKANIESFRDGRPPRSTDIFIAVMGVTGSGKSSFISHCCGKSVKIGHELASCTNTVDVYAYDVSPSRTVYLIDTPGFDDTNRNDTEVLRIVAAWLQDSCKAKILLRGIIYFHRIIDPRMQGSAKKNVLMFRNLCGEEALKNVILVTSMWDKVPLPEAKAREKELIDTENFWGFMVSRGSTVLRHDNSPESARVIVRHFIEGEGEAMMLQVQDEIVTKNRPLEKTTVGLEVYAMNTEKEKQNDRERREMLQMIQDLRLKGEEAERARCDTEEEFARIKEQLHYATQRLQASAEDLHKERLASIAAATMQNQKAEQERVLEELLRETKKLKRAAKRRRRKPKSRSPSPGPPESPFKTTQPFSENARTKFESYRPFISFNGEDSITIFGSQSLNHNLDKYGLAEVSKASKKGDLSFFFAACGSNNTWVATTLSKDKSQISTHWSAELPTEYPLLHRALIGNASQPLIWLTLGPNQEYYARWRDASDYNLPPSVWDAIESSPSGWQGMTSLALGPDATYVLITKKDGWKWNLKGYYGKLDDHLNALKQKPQGIALDITGTKHYILKGPRNEDIWYSLSRRFLKIVDVSTLFEPLTNVKQ